MYAGHEKYIKRCFDLAILGGINVRPNPMVGAVLVYNDRIIGEGFHEFFGGPHAEVNALNNVKESDRYLIPDSTLYISLEPCNTVGKTPACSDLILKNHISKVVVSSTDPNPAIQGNSISYLKSKGIEVISGVLAEEGDELIKVFRKNIINRKPYIVLKYAESKDHFIAPRAGRMKLSNEISDVMVHKLRSEVEGIMIGTNTAVTDSPMLNVRLIEGKNPDRVILDKHLKIKAENRLFSVDTKTYIINEIKEEIKDNLIYVKFNFENEFFLNDLMSYLFQSGIYTLLVEGGAKLHESLIKNNLWDEAIIISTQHIISNGVKSAKLKGKLTGKYSYYTDEIFFVRNLPLTIMI